MPNLHILFRTAVGFVIFHFPMYPHGLKRDRSPICGFMERVSLDPNGVVFGYLSSWMSRFFDPAETCATSKRPKISPNAFASLDSLDKARAKASRMGPITVASRTPVSNAVQNTERLLDFATAGRAIRVSLIRAPRASIKLHVRTDAGEAVDLARSLGGVCGFSPNAIRQTLLTDVNVPTE